MAEAVWDFNLLDEVKEIIFYCSANNDQKPVLKNILFNMRWSFTGLALSRKLLSSL